MRRLFHFEPRHLPVASPREFSTRLLRNGLWALVIVVLGLAVGITGYMATEGWSLLDAFVNAAMILSGMGPMDDPVTVAGKIFSGTYAIACGLLFFGVAAIVIAPLLHRVLHRFHVEEREK